MMRSRCGSPSGTRAICATSPPGRMAALGRHALAGRRDARRFDSRARSAARPQKPPSQAAKELTSAKTVAAVERMARADRRLAATVDQWDADPWLLNTPAGVIDLRTGSCATHRASDYMTKITAVAPGSGCPLWRAFLTRHHGRRRAAALPATRAATAYRRDLASTRCSSSTAPAPTARAYSSRPLPASWATITGPRRSRPSPPSRTPSDRPRRAARRAPGDRHRDRGGKALGGGQDQELTGGDQISARFMRQDFFEFTAAVQAADHRQPQARPAHRRRGNPPALQPIPFTVTIPPNERDPD